jgi:hypothetical protein
VIYVRIKLTKYLRERDAANRKNDVSNKSRLFFKGLNALERKKWEMILARVKKQCSGRTVEQRAQDPQGRPEELHWWWLMNSRLTRQAWRRR